MGAYRRHYDGALNGLISPYKLGTTKQPKTTLLRCGSGHPKRHPMPRLTDLKLRDVKTPERELLLSDGGNLFLRIRPTGSKTWIVRIKRNGKRRVHTLGAYPAT